MTLKKSCIYNVQGTSRAKKLDLTDLSVTMTI